MFEPFEFTEAEILKFLASAENDVKNARSIDIPEVMFLLCFQALCKMACTVCAKQNLRVKSKSGHHVFLIRKLSETLGDEEIELIGNQMRMKRNMDMYAGGAIVSEKEALEYRDWIGKLMEKVKKHLKLA